MYYQVALDHRLFLNKSLIAPNRDPRDAYETPILKSDVLSIEDLSKNMKLSGTVRNVVDFGAFIDIGVKPFKS